MLFPLGLQKICKKDLRVHVTCTICLSENPEARDPFMSRAFTRRHHDDHGHGKLRPLCVCIFE